MINNLDKNKNVDINKGNSFKSQFIKQVIFFYSNISNILWHKFIWNPCTEALRKPFG